MKENLCFKSFFAIQSFTDSPTIDRQATMTFRRLKMSFYFTLSLFLIGSSFHIEKCSGYKTIAINETELVDLNQQQPETNLLSDDNCKLFSSIFLSSIESYRNNS